MKKLIRQILKEETETPIAEPFYIKLYEKMDEMGAIPFTKKVLPHLGLEVEEEIDLIHSYLTKWEGGDKDTMDIVLDPEEISHLFRDSRDYDIQDLVLNYLKDTYDYDAWGWECMDVNEYIIGDINDKNMKTIKKFYKKEDDEDWEDIEDYMENGDISTEIGCSYSDAQRDADMNYLHEDIHDEMIDVLSKLDGKWDWNDHTYKATISLSDVAPYSDLYMHIENILHDGYDLNELLDAIFTDEMENVRNGYDDGEIFFGELGSINTDRHFRYGGAGTVDVEYFNDILEDRLHHF